MALTTIKIEQRTKDKLKVRAAQRKKTYTKLLEYYFKLEDKQKSSAKTA